MAVNTEKGLSLIELIIVIAIIAIALGFAVPAFNHYSANANLKTAALDIVSDIYSMREKALAENRQYMIEFTLISNQYTLNQGTYAGAPWTAIQVKSPSVIGKDIKLLIVNFGNYSNKLSFQTRGTAKEFGSLSIVNRYNSIATITVNSAGRTYVQYTLQ